jgi:hypothetical protein
VSQGAFLPFNNTGQPLPGELVSRVGIENIAKHYFDFIGQDLPGFQNLEGLSARTKLKSVRCS